MVAHLIRRWWYSRQLQQALKKGQFQRANHFLKQLESLNIKLPCSAKLYQQNLQLHHSVNRYKQETFKLKKQLQSTSTQDYLLKPNLHFIEQIYQSFKFIEHDKHKLQITGIDKSIFDDLEIALSDFVEAQINKVKPESRETKLQEALDDLLGLKKGIDPSYSYFYSPHVYLLKYFTENIYCTYIAWFLIYQSGLLPKNIKILDLAAGPGTVIYGLALLLNSLKDFSLPEIHISYYSLEQQAALQYRGLQFWRSYIESLSGSVNAYFRFNTLNIFDYYQYNSKLPSQFFDFIVISHCFFYEEINRQESHQIYRQIFEQSLQSKGYVLLIVQGRKLFNMYNVLPTENIIEEQTVIELFLNELGLNLKWYKYLTSTGKRTPINTNFGKFAKDNLPPQQYLKNIRQKYLKESYLAHYAIDDYVILARKNN